MKEFKKWWARHWLDKPHWLHERCFEAGFAESRKNVFKRVFRTLLALVFVSIVSLSIVLLAGCKDVYRYPCQNPDNFYKEECQKPKCLFTQQCPEYLVAPILEKQVNAVQQPTEPAPNR
jgi:hypothetical protein